MYGRGSFAHITAVVDLRPCRLSMAGNIVARETESLCGRGGNTSAKGRRLAAERWKILKDTIISAKRKTATQDFWCHMNAASVRRFTSFNLFAISEALQATVKRDEGSSSKQMQPQDGVDSSQPHTPVCGIWLKYEPTADTAAHLNMSGSTPVTVIIKHITESTSLEALMGFNNTGNICVWPSEEVLAFYCLKYSKQFEGKAVCELGCGMTGLAGVTLACTQLPSRVLLTDGNETSVENVKEILDKNRANFGRAAVSAEVLLWDKDFLQNTSPHGSQFDCVICADCLFFEDVHNHLAQVIIKLLKPTGTALLLAPQRSGTFDKFCAVAKHYFKVQARVQYDDLIWQKHREALKQFGSVDVYTPDLHYPLQLTLHPL